jgi:hypothetical protein
MALFGVHGLVRPKSETRCFANNLLIIPGTVNRDSSLGFFPMLSYRQDFVDVAQTFHLSLVVTAPHFCWVLIQVIAGGDQRKS